MAVLRAELPTLDEAQRRLERETQQTIEKRNDLESETAKLQGRQEAHQRKLDELAKERRELTEMDAKIAPTLREQLDDATAALCERAADDLVDWTLGRLQRMGAEGARTYGAGQRLVVFTKDFSTKGDWVDVVVEDAPAAEPRIGSVAHHLRSVAANESVPARSFKLNLHPWNHAPFELPHATFEASRLRYFRTLRAQHACIVDALSGRRLNVFDQCVPLQMAEASLGSGGQLSGVVDVASLSTWLHGAYAHRCFGEASKAACVLLTAGPAAGKTSLISQLMMHTLHEDGSHEHHHGGEPKPLARTRPLFSFCSFSLSLHAFSGDTQSCVRAACGTVQVSCQS